MAALAKIAAGSRFVAMKLVVGALLLLAVPAAVVARDKHDRIAMLVASTDGASKATAFKVKSVDEEYKILRALGLRPERQSLVIGDDKHPYDVLTAVAEDGTKRVLWFDIKSFYGRELGF